MMTVERHIGKHVFAVYDDIVLGTLDGTFCVEDARQYVELLSEIVRKHHEYYACGDLRRMGQFPPETRRVMVEGHKTLHCAGVAIIGAPFLLRTMIVMAVRALSAIGKNDAPLRFVANQEEAMAWLSAQRAQRQKKS